MWKKIFIAVISVLIILVLVGPLLLMPSIYENFAEPMQTPDLYEKAIENYVDMTVTEGVVTNDEITLATYLFQKPDTTAKGTIIFSHGMGGRTTSYLDLIHYFVEHQYQVLAFDHLGHGATISLNNPPGIGGLPNGIIGLRLVLDTVMEQNKIDRPLFVLAQSWGAYSAGAALADYPEISGAILLAPFNDSIDFMVAVTREQAGDAFAQWLKPYYHLYERFRFGKQASGSVVDSLTRTKIPVQIYISKDDSIVTANMGEAIYVDKLANTDNVELIIDEDRGHTYTYYTAESRRNIDAVEKAYQVDNQAVTSEDFQAVLALDEAYLEQMVKFFDQQLP